MSVCDSVNLGKRSVDEAGASFGLNRKVKAFWMSAAGLLDRLGIIPIPSQVFVPTNAILCP